MCARLADDPPYDGDSGRTARERAHYVCSCGAVALFELYGVVSATSDPEAAERALAGELNTFRCGACSAPVAVEAPFVYHDAPARLFALVLPPAARHRELDERAALYRRLAGDRSAPAPAYVREARVVYGRDGLRAALAAATSAGDLDAQRSALGRDRADLRRRERELELRVQLVESRSRTLEARERGGGARPAPPPSPPRGSPDGPDTAVDAPAPPAPREASSPAAVAPTDPRPRTSPAGAPRDPDTSALNAAVRATLARDPIPAEALTTQRLGSPAGLVAAVSAALGAEAAPGPTPAATPGGSPAPRPAAPTPREAAIERCMLARARRARFLFEGQPYLAASLPADALEPLVAAPALVAEVRLHRLANYPLVVVSLGALAVGVEDPPSVSFLFDVCAREDRAVLDRLAENFHAVLDLYDVEYLSVVARPVRAALSENVRCVLGRADGHLASLPEGARSYAQACASYGAPGFDQRGRKRHGFTEDSFRELPTPAAARLALGIVAYWSEPENEAYLVEVKSFPLPHWRRIRERVVTRAVELGLALSPLLRRAALELGLAASAEVLVRKQISGFAELALRLRPMDLDPVQESENWTALLGECEALSVDVDPGIVHLAAAAARRAHEADAAGDDADGAPAEEGPASGPTAPLAAPGGEGTERSLIDALARRDERLAAAIELCRRGARAALPALGGALHRMSRAEAADLLPRLLSAFGRAAEPVLVEGLGARRSYVRQGCALALGVLRSERSTDALADLLVGEPTEVWREVARALGDVGAPAVMAIAARLRDAADDALERGALALAHVAARGGRGPVKALAAGRDARLAPVAARALALAAEVGDADQRVRAGGPAAAELTVVRAFSRRFYQALDAAETRPPGERTEELAEEDLVEAPE